MLEGFHRFSLPNTQYQPEWKKGSKVDLTGLAFLCFIFPYTGPWPTCQVFQIVIVDIPELLPLLLFFFRWHSVPLFFSGFGWNFLALREIPLVI